MSVEQGYESMKGQHNYKTSTRTTYGGRGQPMDIERTNNNFKDGKPKCFNCNKYGHIARDCQEKKKEQEIRKYDKEGHIAKDCKGKQMMKNRKVKKDSDDEDNKKEEGFGKDLK